LSQKLPHVANFLSDWLINWGLLRTFKHLASGFPGWRHDGEAGFAWNSIIIIHKVRAKMPDIAREFVAKNRSLNDSLNHVLCNSIFETSDTGVELLSSRFADTLCSVSHNIPRKWMNLMPYFEQIFAIHKGLFLKVWIYGWNIGLPTQDRIFKQWWALRWNLSIFGQKIGCRMGFSRDPRTGRLASFLWSDSTATELIICPLFPHSEPSVTRPYPFLFENGCRKVMNGISVHKVSHA
jgi:hypothetical protein